MDKSSGKENKITITNDKGRLSKDEIERMVSDAEKYKKEDESQRDRISAKNSLESYCFNMKTTINDEKLADKIDADDKKKITDAIEEALKWMETNQLAEKDEFEHKLKEVEKICSPVMTKLYGGAGGAGGMPSGFPGAAGGPQPGAGGSAGPTIEEVD
ncbi:unnamed protein product [Adineta ricciae]|nr:unnamed protein product [Adineta ricciae]